MSNKFSIASFTNVLSVGVKAETSKCIPSRLFSLPPSSIYQKASIPGVNPWSKPVDVHTSSMQRLVAPGEKDTSVGSATRWGFCLAAPPAGYGRCCNDVGCRLHLIEVRILPGKIRKAPAPWSWHAIFDALGISLLRQPLATGPLIPFLDRCERSRELGLRACRLSMGAVTTCTCIATQLLRQVMPSSPRILSAIVPGNEAQRHFYSLNLSCHDHQPGQILQICLHQLATQCLSDLRLQPSQVHLSLSVDIRLLHVWHDCQLITCHRELPVVVINPLLLPDLSKIPISL